MKRIRLKKLSTILVKTIEYNAFIRQTLELSITWVAYCLR